MDEYSRSGDNVKKFLNTALRQVDRLNHIIEDLLSLSRIEQAEKGDFQAQKPSPIKGVASA